MSRPRPVYPGATHLSTRCVHKRQLLLRPSKRINQLIEYTVAVLAERHGIELHALCFESNHKHDVATDPNARIVDFQRELHSIITRQVNCAYGEFGSLWAPGDSGRAECADIETVLDKIIYTMANPVQDGLVAHGYSWPGVRRAWPAKDKVIERPADFFRDHEQGGKWPKTATLRFTRPPGYDHLADDELAALIRGGIEAREVECRTQMRAEGRRFLGRKACLAASRYAYPTTRRVQFGINPKVAGRTEARIQALEKLALFREHHDAARAAFNAGQRDVLFPHGTWKMRVYCGARCRPPPR